ncbi:MAG: hypothetical protein AAF151_09870 [Cyanobacteria bacterium J06656_5]
MKNLINISPSKNGAQCSLCEDTLLRHISQNRMFWYCPSCRQEMVCEGKKVLAAAHPTSSDNSQAVPQRQLLEVANRRRRVGVS